MVLPEKKYFTSEVMNVLLNEFKQQFIVYYYRALNSEFMNIKAWLTVHRDNNTLNPQCRCTVSPLNGASCRGTLRFVG